jgi:hypothetical protein
MKSDRRNAAFFKLSGLADSARQALETWAR